MKEKIIQIIADLLMERANIKQTLKYFGDRLENEEIDKYLERLSEIKNLIEKLEKGLE